MKIYGLVGFPIGHSFSSKYFTEKFQSEKVDATYHNFQMEDVQELSEILKNNHNIAGLNITIPHKTNIFAFLNEVDETAKAIGAVNVVKACKTNDGYHLKGYNTDVIGFENSLVPQLKPTHKKALVFGTGGASKAVIYVLKKLGIQYKYVSRTQGKGQFTYKDITHEIVSEYTLLINCTPLGMSPKQNLCPDIPYNSITQNHYLFDLIYNPEQSIFLKRGADKGADTKNGLDMLHLQADAAWEIWNS